MVSSFELLGGASDRSVLTITRIIASRADRWRLLDMGKTYRKRESDTRRSRPSQSQIKEAMRWLETRKSRIHGRGVFARRDIPAGMRLIEYVGMPVSKQKAAELTTKQNRYLFTLNGVADLNGKFSWNPARLINHSCEPNCEAILDDNDHVWMFSTKPIARGEEVTFNYGYSIDGYMNFPCRCGAPSCTGYMVAEEFLPLVRTILAEQRR